MKAVFHANHQQLQQLRKIELLLAKLSRKEQMIARLSAMERLPCEAIAQKLGVSTKTARNYMLNISKKASQVFGEHFTFQHTVTRLYCYWFIFELGDSDQACQFRVKR